MSIRAVCARKLAIDFSSCSNSVLSNALVNLHEMDFPRSDPSNSSDKLSDMERDWNFWSIFCQGQSIDHEHRTVWANEPLPPSKISLW
jgi:hypothetical protein